jgi:putative ABC transport system permease protein
MACSGLATAVFALGFGGVASWFVVSRIMTLPSELHAGHRAG